MHVLQITHKADRYSDDDLGLHIEIPDGAILESEKLILNIGVCLQGPFKFPEGSTPITPVLMLWPKEDVKLDKPLKITLPIIIEQPNTEYLKVLGIHTLKSEHIKHNGLYVFEERSINDLDLSTKDGFEYATFSLSHLCFLTLFADTSKVEIARRGKYCICPLVPLNATSSHTIYYYYIQPTCTLNTFHSLHCFTKI